MTHTTDIRAAIESSRQNMLETRSLLSQAGEKVVIAHDDLAVAVNAVALAADAAEEKVAVLQMDLTEADQTIARLEARIAELTGTQPPPGPVDPPPAPTDPRPRLSWRPPALASSAITVDLSKTTDVAAYVKSGKIVLGSGDYLVKLPADRAWVNQRGLEVNGGRNVVIVGGLVDCGSGYYSGGTGPGVMADGRVQRAAYFLGQTGTIHLEGVAFTSSAGFLSEGVNISAPNARAQVQNVRHLVPLKGTQGANHADALQSWSGPRWLGVDGFEAQTGYQGMFLNAHDTQTSSPVDPDWVLRNVEIVGVAGAKYILWLNSPPARVITENVFTSGGLGNWDAANDWPAVKHGTRAPAAVLAGPRSAGLGYVTPGYAA